MEYMFKLYSEINTGDEYAPYDITDESYFNDFDKALKAFDEKVESDEIKEYLMSTDSNRVVVTLHRIKFDDENTKSEVASFLSHTEITRKFNFEIRERRKKRD